MADVSTADRILDVAQELVQTRGYNGFSYADISAALKIRKASIHHHFPTKADLGKRLVERYHDAFRGRLDEIAREAPDARARLRRYAQVYADVLRQDGRMCLCGMLAADFTTLPRPLRDALRRFFDENEGWLADVLARGRKAGTLRFDGPPEAQARLLVSGLEGAMLVARSYGDVSRLEQTAARLLAGLGVKA